MFCEADCTKKTHDLICLYLLQIERCDLKTCLILLFILLSNRQKIRRVTPAPSKIFRIIKEFERYQQERMEPRNHRNRVLSRLMLNGCYDPACSGEHKNLTHIKLIGKYNLSHFKTKFQCSDFRYYTPSNPVLHRGLDWRTLPHDRLAAENSISSTTSQASLYIPLREEVLAISNGDGISEFHFRPVNVTSDLCRLYPRCLALAGFKIASIWTNNF